MFDRISKAFASADSTPPGILAEVRDHVSGNGSAPDRLDWLKVLVRRDPHRIPGL